MKKKVQPTVKMKITPVKKVTSSIEDAIEDCMSVFPHLFIDEDETNRSELKDLSHRTPYSVSVHAHTGLEMARGLNVIAVELQRANNLKALELKLLAKIHRVNKVNHEPLDN